MLKRPRDVYDSDATSPLAATSSPPKPFKRPHVFTASSSPFIPRSSPALVSTPYSYYAPRTPFSVPSDSPTNPFGLKRSLVALELPRPTSFGKHLPLRFQLVCDGDYAGSKKKERGGTYRVVQVPTNYTFRHLHKLILFLFASDIEQYHADKRPGPSKPRRTASKEQGSTAKSKGKARAAPSVSSRRASRNRWRGHVFEVQKHVNLHRDSVKPGAIRAGGKTVAKLSSVRERSLFPDLYVYDTPLKHDGPAFHDTSDASSRPLGFEDESDEDAKQGWKWEAEDDYTVGHVWPRGPTLDRGIIYRHTATTSVHVTINTLPVPSRKGISNEPFVFLAQGHAGASIRMSNVIINSDGSQGRADVCDDAPQLLGSAAQIARWNKPEAFDKFLQCEAERERALLRHTPPPDAHADTDADAGTESSASAPDTSSVFDGVSEGAESDGDASVCSDAFLFPFALSAITPYPAHPARQRRVERAHRRMERLTRSGLAAMESESEEEKEKAKGEMSEDGGGGEGDDWDPFGDEAELCV